MKRRATPRVYRSHRALKVLLKILLALVILFIVGTVALFFGLRRYIRYTPEDTLYLEIPWLGYNVSSGPEETAAPPESPSSPASTPPGGTDSRPKGISGSSHGAHTESPGGAGIVIPSSDKTSTNP